ncbi:hypothetical protein ABVT39_008240 [Epinephelus coioides]
MHARTFVISQQVHRGLDKTHLTPASPLSPSPCFSLSPSEKPKAVGSRALSNYSALAQHRADCSTLRTTFHLFPSALRYREVTALLADTNLPKHLDRASVGGGGNVFRGASSRRQMLETRGQCPQTRRGGRHTEQ